MVRVPRTKAEKIAKIIFANVLFIFINVFAVM